MTTPRDSLDLRNIRDGGRREIRWDALERDALPESLRTRVGKTWLERMRQEHLAVGAFALIAQELAAEGCDSIVLAMITRAAADEVRHADVCKRLAQKFLGDAAVPARFKGLPRVPPHARATKRERALFHVVEMCCLNETFTGVFLTEMLARATHPTARDAVESLLEDEIDHGRVGWAYLNTACRDGWGKAALRAELPRIFERALTGVFAASSTERDADERAREAYGYIGITAGVALQREALAKVILPGFESASIDVSAVRKIARDRAWLAS